MSLAQVTTAVSNLPFAGTDCALPMLDALKHNLKVDAFIGYNDSETWAGKIHPLQALREYRQKTGIPAKLIVVGMIRMASRSPIRRSLECSMWLVSPPIPLFRHY